MSRETFLARVRQAAAIGRAYRVDVDEVPAGAGYVGGRGDDLCQAMAAEVNEVGGIAHVVSGIDAGREQLLDLLDQYCASNVLMWQHDVLLRIGLKETLNDAGIDVLDHDRLSAMNADDARDAYLAADVGVTSCDIGVAETGSLIVCSRPGQERIASLVPPVHIAVVLREQIVADLFDAFAKLDAVGFDDVASNIAIITGPSKTGDIELTLTTGVHGPGKWHAIIVA